MFREMRRFKQQLSAQACRELLQRGTSGVLAVSGDDGYPYAVPLSYVYEDGRLWFHCAQEGHKLDALRRCPKASFCVIARDDVIPAQFTTHYESVIAFGQVRILADEREKRAALLRIAARYTPDDAAGCAQEVEKTLSRACLLEFTVEHMTGKAARELVQTTG